MATLKSLNKRVQVLEALVHQLLHHPNITDYSNEYIKIGEEEDEEMTWKIKRKPIGFVPPSKQKRKK